MHAATLTQPLGAALNLQQPAGVCHKNLSGILVGHKAPELVQHMVDMLRVHKPAHDASFAQALPQCPSVRAAGLLGELEWVQ